MKIYKVKNDSYDTEKKNLPLVQIRYKLRPVSNISVAAAIKDSCRKKIPDIRGDCQGFYWSLGG